MSSPIRWDPFREMPSLREAMNQLVEQAVMRPGYGGWALANGVYGQMNVSEVNGKYYCQVLLPGIAPDDIELTVRQNTLALKATVPEPMAEDHRKNATYLLREFGAGEFTRSITFPKDVNASAVEAEYQDGVLTIVIPLAQHAQPRRITVRGSSNSSGGKQVKQPHKTGEQFIESQQPVTVGGEVKQNGN